MKEQKSEKSPDEPFNGKLNLTSVAVACQTWRKKVTRHILLLLLVLFPSFVSYTIFLPPFLSL